MLSEMLSKMLSEMVSEMLSEILSEMLSEMMSDVVISSKNSPNSQIRPTTDQTYNKSDLKQMIFAQILISGLWRGIL